DRAVTPSRSALGSARRCSDWRKTTLGDTRNRRIPNQTGRKTYPTRFDTGRVRATEARPWPTHFRLLREATAARGGEKVKSLVGEERRPKRHRRLTPPVEKPGVGPSGVQGWVGDRMLQPGTIRPDK